MLSEQEKSEIRASYKNAIDPRQHVKILMQLYLVSHEEILDVLGLLSSPPAQNRAGRASRDASMRRSSRQRQWSACAPENLSGGWLRIWASMCGPWLHGPIMYEGRKKTDAKL
mgnify:CR=1 FL=1